MKKKYTGEEVAAMIKEQLHASRMMSGHKTIAREYVANYLEAMNSALQQNYDHGYGDEYTRLEIMRNNICIKALREG